MYLAALGSLPTLNVYDNNGLRTVLHFAKNAPREDVSVLVVSTINMNSVPVKSFTFQAAVPKVKFTEIINLFEAL